MAKRLHRTHEEVCCRLCGEPMEWFEDDQQWHCKTAECGDSFENDQQGEEEIEHFLDNAQNE